MTDTLDADARWDAAAKLASGVVDEKFRSRRRKTVAWISALIVACLLVGVALGLWLLLLLVMVPLSLGAFVVRQRTVRKNPSRR